MKEKILIVVVGMIFAIICVKTFVLDEYSEGGKRSFYILELLLMMKYYMDKLM